jgi:hypothetical protein
MKRIKITSAVMKKGFGTYSPGYKIRVGIVPVKNPIGQISVNMNPINAVVRITKPMRMKYFT